MKQSQTSGRDMLGKMIANVVPILGSLIAPSFVNDPVASLVAGFGVGALLSVALFLIDGSWAKRWQGEAMRFDTPLGKIVLAGVVVIAAALASFAYYGWQDYAFFHRRHFDLVFGAGVGAAFSLYTVLVLAKPWLRWRVPAI